MAKGKNQEKKGEAKDRSQNWYPEKKMYKYMHIYIYIYISMQITHCQYRYVLSRLLKFQGL